MNTCGNYKNYKLHLKSFHKIKLISSQILQNFFCTLFKVFFCRMFFSTFWHACKFSFSLYTRKHGQELDVCVNTVIPQFLTKKKTSFDFGLFIFLKFKFKLNRERNWQFSLHPPICRIQHMLEWFCSNTST